MAGPTIDNAMPNPSPVSSHHSVTVHVLRLDRYVAAAELAQIHADWLISDDFIALLIASGLLRAKLAAQVIVILTRCTDCHAGSGWLLVLYRLVRPPIYPKDVLFPCVMPSQSHCIVYRCQISGITGFLQPF